MLVKTHWPALIPAIERAGHEPVLIYPLEGNVPPPTEVCEGLVIGINQPEDPKWVRTHINGEFKPE